MIDLAEFVLRPVHAGDSGRLLQWRNSDRVRMHMYTDHVISDCEHTDWFERMRVDASRDYRICERRGGPIGLVALTGIDPASRRASWAFYVGDPGAPSGCGAAMEYLALEYAFRTRKLRKLCCEVLASNARVVKQHLRFGFREEGRLVAQVLKNGAYEDVILLATFAQDWASVRAQLEATLFRGTANASGR